MSNESSENDDFTSLGGSTKISNDDTKDISNESNPLLRRPTPGLFNYTHFNGFTRFVTLAAVALEPLYSWFLWNSTAEAIEKTAEYFGAAPDPVREAYIKWGVLPFAMMNLLGDLTAVQPLREADELAAPSSPQQKREYSKRILGLFLKGMAVLTSFPIGALADVDPIAGFFNANHSSFNETDFDANTTGTNKILIETGEALTIAVVALLGIAYYGMLTNQNIQNHADAFVEAIKHFPKTLKNLIANPLRHLEVFLQIMGNTAYRGISFTYILSDIFEKYSMFDRLSPVTKKALSGGTGITTAIVTLFSRLLKTQDKFVNPKFEQLRDKDFKNIPRFWSGLIRDAVLTLLRAGSIAYMTDYALDYSSLSKGYCYAIDAVVGGVVLSHGLYVNYTAGRQRLALEAKNKNTLQQTVYEPIDVDNNEAHAVEEAIKQFDKIAETHRSPWLEGSIVFVNFCARLTRFVAFYLFAETVNQIFLDGALASDAVAALAVLWGGEVFKSDGDNYHAWIKGTAQAYSTQWDLQKQRNPRDWAPQRFFKTIATSPYSYSVDEINQLHDKTFTPSLNT